MSSTARLGSATVNRVGFGAMQLPGPHVFGPPRDRPEALAVLRRAVEAGVDHIDTAWYYGPDVANELIREALSPYGDELRIVTKLGGARADDASWIPSQRPEQLREGIEKDLAQLGVEHVHASNLRLMGEAEGGGEVPLADQLAEMVALREEGKIGHIGLSNCTLAQLDEALAMTEIACVQNPFNVLERGGEDVLRRCAEQDIAYVPFFPVGSGFGAVANPREDPVVRTIAESHGATTTQVALAWLLAHDEHVLLIPGTSSLAHLEENLASGELRLTPEDVATLDALAPPA